MTTSVMLFSVLSKNIKAETRKSENVPFNELNTSKGATKGINITTDEGRRKSCYN